MTYVSFKDYKPEERKKTAFFPDGEADFFIENVTDGVANDSGAPVLIFSLQILHHGGKSGGYTQTVRKDLLWLLLYILKSVGIHEQPADFEFKDIIGKQGKLVFGHTPDGQYNKIAKWIPMKAVTDKLADEYAKNGAYRPSSAALSAADDLRDDDIPF